LKPAIKRCKESSVLLRGKGTNSKAASRTPENRLSFIVNRKLRDQETDKYRGPRRTIKRKGVISTAAAGTGVNFPSLRPMEVLRRRCKGRRSQPKLPLAREEDPSRTSRVLIGPKRAARLARSISARENNKGLAAKGTMSVAKIPLPSPKSGPMSGRRIQTRLLQSFWY
jgi:hypothetical protein